ncbi:hypothetical protein Q8B32_003727 [Salmonella enterica]|nr:hypothetical protein [Salmonella enterica]ELI2743862.1 hypothetical protein [Salmonella enterica]
MTNNKLPEWRKALNKAVENYQSTQAWYEENPDAGRRARSNCPEQVGIPLCFIFR